MCGARRPGRPQLVTNAISDPDAARFREVGFRTRAELDLLGRTLDDLPPRGSPTQRARDREAVVALDHLARSGPKPSTPPPSTPPSDATAAVRFRVAGTATAPLGYAITGAAGSPGLRPAARGAPRRAPAWDRCSTPRRRAALGSPARRPRRRRQHRPHEPHRPRALRVARLRRAPHGPRRPRARRCEGVRETRALRLPSPRHRRPRRGRRAARAVARVSRHAAGDGGTDVHGAPHHARGSGSVHARRRGRDVSHRHRERAARRDPEPQRLPTTHHPRRLRRHRAGQYAEGRAHRRARARPSKSSRWTPTPVGGSSRSGCNRRTSLGI